jgi:hypothetical protein
VCEQRSPVDFLSADRDRGRRRRGGAFRSAGARPYGETAAPRKYGNNSPPRRCPRNRLIWRGDRFNDVYVGVMSIGTLDRARKPHVRKLCRRVDKSSREAVFLSCGGNWKVREWVGDVLWRFNAARVWPVARIIYEPGRNSLLTDRLDVWHRHRLLDTFFRFPRKSTVSGMSRWHSVAPE